VYRGYPSIVTSFFAKKTLTKTAGVLEHCSEGETSFWVLHFSRLFLLTTSPRRLRISVCISLFTVAIPLLILANCCKLYKEIPGTFWSYCVLYFSLLHLPLFRVVLYIYSRTKHPRPSTACSHCQTPVFLRTMNTIFPSRLIPLSWWWRKNSCETL